LRGQFLLADTSFGVSDRGLTAAMTGLEDLRLGAPGGLAPSSGWLRGSPCFGRPILQDSLAEIDRSPTELWPPSPYLRQRVATIRDAGHIALRSTKRSPIGTAPTPQDGRDLSWRRELRVPGGPAAPRKPARRLPAPEGNIGEPNIDLGPLKRVARQLPAGNLARELILQEADALPRGEYCVKVVVWFQLIRASGDK
jgi:hypothetical protein